MRSADSGSARQTLPMLHAAERSPFSFKPVDWTFRHARQGSIATREGLPLFGQSVLSHAAAPFSPGSFHSAWLKLQPAFMMAYHKKARAFLTVSDSPCRKQRSISHLFFVPFGTDLSVLQVLPAPEREKTDILSAGDPHCGKHFDILSERYPDIHLAPSQTENLRCYVTFYLAYIQPYTA